MIPELHLFIIWPNARPEENRILQGIHQKFEIIRVYEVSWSSNHFSTNMSRFYGQNLPPGSSKERHCGRGPFLLILVRDLSPVYEKRETSKGMVEVNINTFDAKSLYRSWTGGGHRIHSTNSPKETYHDISLLGIDLEDLQRGNHEIWDGQINEWTKDLVGSDGWENIEQFFYVLNHTVTYIVLRNFECLPNEYHMESHGDIDLLTDNYKELCYIANSQAVFPKVYRVHNKIKISGEYIFFDFRYLGDDYYDKSWEESILHNRIMSPKGFFVPTEKDYFYTLFYHGFMHKPKMHKDYIDRFIVMGEKLNIPNSSIMTFSNSILSKKLLDDYMKNMNYRYVKPKDKSVYFNRKNISLVRKIRNRLRKLVKDAYSLNYS